MPSRIVVPETRKLDISYGDWLLVKKRLNAGEQRAMFARMSKEVEDGTLRVNRLQIGIATIVAYLVDWSLTDLHGKQIPIAGQPLDKIEAALNSFSTDDVNEIRDAIEAHINEVAAEREAEKNAQAGAIGSAAISPSPSAAVGVLSGSVN